MLEVKYLKNYNCGKNKDLLIHICHRIFFTKKICELKEKYDLFINNYISSNQR